VPQAGRDQIIDAVMAVDESPSLATLLTALATAA
jgi:hypothetical protein